MRLSRNGKQDKKLRDLERGREHPVGRAIHVILLLLMVLLAVVVAFLGYSLVTTHQASLESNNPTLGTAPPEGHKADEAQT